jgi:hypothetical protein
MIQLTWNLARNIKISEKKLYEHMRCVKRSSLDIPISIISARDCIASRKYLTIGINLNKRQIMMKFSHEIKGRMKVATYFLLINCIGSVVRFSPAGNFNFDIPREILYFDARNKILI